MERVGCGGLRAGRGPRQPSPQRPSQMPSFSKKHPIPHLRVLQHLIPADTARRILTLLMEARFEALSSMFFRPKRAAIQSRAGSSEGCSRVPVDGYPFWMPSAPGRTGEDHPSVQTTISVARGLDLPDWPSVSRRQVRVLCRLDGDRGKTQPRRAGVLAGPRRG